MMLNIVVHQKFRSFKRDVREKEFSVLKRSIETEEMLKKTKFSPKRIEKGKVCIIFRVAEI